MLLQPACQPSISSSWTEDGGPRARRALHHAPDRIVPEGVAGPFDDAPHVVLTRVSERVDLVHDDLLHLCAQHVSAAVVSHWRVEWPRDLVSLERRTQTLLAGRACVEGFQPLAVSTVIRNRVNLNRWSTTTSWGSGVGHRQTRASLDGVRGAGVKAVSPAKAGAERSDAP